MSLTRWQPKGPKNSHVAVAYSGYQMSITEKKETNCQRWLWLMDSWWRSPSPQAMTWPTNGPLLPALKPFTINIQDTSIQSLLLHVFVVGQKFRRATLLAKKSRECNDLFGILDHLHQTTKTFGSFTLWIYELQTYSSINLDFKELQNHGLIIVWQTFDTNQNFKEVQNIGWLLLDTFWYSSQTTLTTDNWILDQNGRALDWSIPSAVWCL